MFEEKLSEMPGDESYFLLTTFANMAMERSHEDYDFVRATTIDLFQASSFDVLSYVARKEIYNEAIFIYSTDWIS